MKEVGITAAAHRMASMEPVIANPSGPAALATNLTSLQDLVFMQKTLRSPLIDPIES